MIDIKTKNLGRSDGVACSMVDVFYVPGTMAEPFGWLAILTARTGTEVRVLRLVHSLAPLLSRHTSMALGRLQVELAQATMWDMVAPRAEREFLRNVFRGGKGEAEREYNPRLHDWAHSECFSESPLTSSVPACCALPLAAWRPERWLSRWESSCQLEAQAQATMPY